MAAAGEAEVTVVDPLPYMTYQPFLPEVAAGSIEPRHAVVAQRRHLKKTNVVTAKVTPSTTRRETATIPPHGGEPGSSSTTSSSSRAVPSRARSPSRHRRERDRPEVDRGGRVHPRPGPHELRQGIDPPARSRARAPAHVRRRRRRLRRHRGVRRAPLVRERAAQVLPAAHLRRDRFHLIEAMGRIMPEVR